MNTQIQSYWQTIFEVSNDVLLLVYADSYQILQANNSAIQFFGHSLNFLKKSFFSDFLISETPSEWDDFINLIQLGVIDKKESKIICKNHDLKNIEIKAINFEPVEEKPTLLLVIQPIENHSEKAERLHQKLKFYETILMQMPTEFAVLNSHWQYLFVNKNSIKDDEFREWIIGKTDYDFCRYRNKPYTLAENRHKMYNELARTKTGKEWIDEHELPDGSIKYVLRKLFPYFEDGKLSMNFGFGIDVTEIKEAESKQKEVLQKLSLQNEELTQFAYITTHDLKEPLRNISSFTNLLQRRHRDHLPPDAQEFMDFIIGNAKRMNNLLIALKSYVTIDNEYLKKQPTDLNEVVQNALSNLHWLIGEKKAKIHFENLPIVSGHLTYLTQLFQNLINNAIKFCQKHPEIHIICEEKDTHFLCKVSDNGIGIPPPFQVQIFRIFNRLDKQNYEGTGMGLSICKKMVQLHGGRIWVESDGENGSTFIFELEK